LTTAQDYALKQMLADGKVTVREAAEHLMTLQPKIKA